MIKAVIFDIDGVLIDSFEANLKFFQDLLTYFGFPPPTREEYLKMFHLHMKDVIKLTTKLTSEEEITKIWKAGKSREVAYPLELLNFPNGAEETIKKLSKDYSLGIVTSRVKEGVEGVPQIKQLLAYFKTVVTYEDTDNHKPHPEPLLLAANNLHTNVNECVYVGDTTADVEAAEAAGMKIVIYSKKKLNKADVYTSGFEKLPSLIASL